MPHINLKKKISKSTSRLHGKLALWSLDGCNSPFEKEEGQRGWCWKNPAWQLKTASPSWLQRRPSCNQFLRMEFGNLNLTLRKHQKAAFWKHVLFSADDGKGGTKAKARLVLQGYSDPDLLSGSLETSSPTLNRTSRQVLLSVGVLVPMWLQPFCRETINPANFGANSLEMPALSWTPSPSPWCAS